MKPSSILDRTVAPRRWARFAAFALAVVLMGAVSHDAFAQGRVRPGKWRAGNAADGFKIMKTRTYQVQTQIPQERARLVVDHVEALMSEYHRRFYIRKPIDEFVMKIFENRDGYRGYGGSAGALAHYHPTHRELVCFDTGKLTGREGGINEDDVKRVNIALKSRGLAEELEDPVVKAVLPHLSTPMLLGVLGHESWHQYFHFWIGSKVDFPAWLDEGIADYFYTALVSEDRRKVTTGTLNPMRLPTIYAAIKTESYTPIKEMLRYRRNEYYANKSLHYAQGWSMVYFCWHGGNKKYEKIPEKLIRIFKDKHNMDKATDMAFRGIRIEQFEEDWKRYYLSMDLGEALTEIARDLIGFDPAAQTAPGTTRTPGATDQADAGAGSAR